VTAEPPVPLGLKLQPGGGGTEGGQVERGGGGEGEVERHELGKEKKWHEKCSVWWKIIEKGGKWGNEERKGVK